MLLPIDPPKLLATSGIEGFRPLRQLSVGLSFHKSFTELFPVVRHNNIKNTFQAIAFPYLYDNREKHRIHETLRALDRDVIYCLTNTMPFADAPLWNRYGNLWRAQGDIRDNWERMSALGFGTARYAQFSGHGSWHDPDMLVLGVAGWGADKLHYTHLTPDEQYTHISLWAMLGAPLLLGCNLTRLDDFTRSLLTNTEVLDVDQDPLGLQGIPFWSSGTQVICTKHLEDGSMAGETKQCVWVSNPPLSDLGAKRPYAISGGSRMWRPFPPTYGSRHRSIRTEWCCCASIRPTAATARSRADDASVNGFGAAYDFPRSAVKSIRFEATNDVQVPGTEEAAGTNMQALLFNAATDVPSGTVFTVTIKFEKGALDLLCMKQATAPFNPFITVRSKSDAIDATPRKEVHLTNYKPTPLALTFGGPYGDDLSDPAKGIYYTAATGYPFAIDLTGIDTFDFPQERVCIGDAYPHFKTWAESGGTQAKDWYK